MGIKNTPINNYTTLSSWQILLFYHKKGKKVKKTTFFKINVFQRSSVAKLSINVVQFCFNHIIRIDLNSVSTQQSVTPLNPDRVYRIGRTLDPYRIGKKGEKTIFFKNNVFQRSNVATSQALSLCSTVLFQSQYSSRFEQRQYSVDMGRLINRIFGLIEATQR